ncbi:MAG: ABC transporter permease [Chloroflexi bacterium]|nr:ABC transporter permease [Chloroflexota bacterium]
MADLQRQFAMRQPTNLWRDAWRRLTRNRGAILGMIIIAFFALLAIFAPWIVLHPPLENYPNNSYRQAAWVNLPNEPTRTGDWSFPLGTDTIGRDVLSRVIFGARTSMAVGFIPMILILLIGTSIGMIAGYFGGRVDNFLMRLTDIVYAFPDLLFFIIMITALRDTWIGGLLDGFVLLFVSLALVSWVTVARLVRGQVLSVKEREFVEAARSIGATPARIMLQHVLPNSLAVIIVAAAFLVPQSIVTEAVLGYLGIGIRPTTNPLAPFPTSWGNLLNDGRLAIDAQPWLLIAPALCVALIMLAFTFIGDGLRDALDPMMKGTS